MISGQTSLLDPIWVDCFAGGGGWSTGAELAIGRPMDIAINHDPDAVRMHKTNHPYTRHYCEDVFEVDPRDAVQGRRVMWAHFSPDCKHFSKAKGGKPVDKKIRGLAWVVLKWAALVHPDIISLENVEEFRTWGPVRHGRPVKSRKGETFERWKSQLESLGYQVEYRELTACDFGAPTSRKRFFLMARSDGKPIVWPQPTHGNPSGDGVRSGKLKPWRAAAEIIDWSLPCPSIFDTSDEIREKYGIKAQRPLAEATMKRVARGLDKLVMRAVHPFIIQINHSGERFRGQEMSVPLPTITGKHGYGVCHPIVSPWSVTNVTNATGHSVRSPIDTIRTGGGGGQMLVMPSLVQYHADEAARGQTVTDPVMTIDASPRYAVSAAYLTKYYCGEENYQSAESPLHTVTTKDKEGVTLAWLGKWYNTCTGQQAGEPLHTVTTSAGHFGVITAKLSQTCEDLGRWPKIRSLLNLFCGYCLAEDEILLLAIHEHYWFLYDIGLRMLTPRELFLGQGFPPDYIIDRDYTGKEYPKTKQVAWAGNAVPPQFASALVRANAPEWCVKGIETMNQLNERIAI